MSYAIWFSMDEDISIINSNTRKEKIKNLWRAITFPDDIDEEYDKMCDNAYNKFEDRFINFCYLGST